MAEVKKLGETGAASLEAAADLLDVLIRLHDREADAELIAEMRTR